MRIAVMGTGGVGGYFGARLARAGHQVAFVARGRQLDALRARGLRVESPLGYTSKLWSIGVGLTLPLLDRPRLLAEIHAQDARAEQAVIAYETAIQQAYGEAAGPYAGVLDPEETRNNPAYRVLTPDQAIALGQSLGPDALLLFNPLMGGIPIHEAWRMLKLFETKVLPHFNFTRMTQLAVGKNWRQASPEQQKVLTDEFKTLLVRTYTTAFTQYKNQTVDYKPMRMNPTDTDVVVKSLIKQPLHTSPAHSVHFTILTMPLFIRSKRYAAKRVACA